MEESEFEEIWQLMDKYKFQMTCEIESDLKCVVCKNLIKNARISHCGCRFCKACIEEFLSKGNTICPGNSNSCNDEILDLAKNIWSDNPLNRRILKIPVMCPTQMCLQRNSLKDMKKHLDTCKGPSVKCPFSHLGCNESSLNGEDIDNHLNFQKDNHINITLQKVEDLLIENEALKAENKLINDKRMSENVALNAENKFLHDKINYQEKHITQLEDELENSRKSLHIKLDKLIQDKEDDFRGERNQRAEMEEVIKDLKVKLNAFLCPSSKAFVWKVKLSDIGHEVVSSDIYTHPAGFKMKICVHKKNSQSQQFYQNQGNAFSQPSWATNLPAYPSQQPIMSSAHPSTHTSRQYQLYLQMNDERDNTWQTKPVKLNVTMGIVDQRVNDVIIKSYNKIFEVDNSSRDLKPDFHFQDSDIPESTKLSNILIVKCLVKVEEENTSGLVVE